ncbi:glycosyltransferase [Nocardioides sp.]|uniref:glycosyltransferase n=1 Tax=Nocardioides sp. TaxID=35761 RepID=UPI003518F1E8
MSTSAPRVLVVASTTFERAFLVDTMTRFAATGAEIAFVSVPSVVLGDLGANVTVRCLDQEAEGYPPAFWRRSLLAPPTRRVWLHVERDPWTTQRAAAADVLVALDNRSIFAVWRLAQKNRTAAAVVGQHAGLRAIARAQDGAEPVPVPATPASNAELPAAVVRAFAESAAASAAAAAPAAPEAAPPSPLRRARSLAGRVRRRARAEAGRVRRRLREQPQPAAADATAEQRLGELTRESLDLAAHRRFDEAEAVVAAGVATLPDPRRRADLAGSLAFAELASGHVPGRLLEAVALELAHADDLLARGEPRAAIASFLTAMRLMFAPGVHFDSGRSPLAADPASFAEVLARSEVRRRITAPRGRRTPAAPVPPASERPPRVGVISSGNVNFLGAIRTRLEGAGAEVRTMTRTDLLLARGFPAVLLAKLTDDPWVVDALEEKLRDLLDWADVVLVEWCTETAVLLSTIDPGTTRIVVRLHSYEAWTVNPQLVDFSRVDEVVFVSEHLRELAVGVLPALAVGGSATPRVSVVPNVVDLAPMRRPKLPEARFTLALVGISSIAKDVRWALELVRRLHAHDERYRLLLVGADLEPGTSSLGRAYVADYHREVAQLREQGVVEVLGQRRDVGEVLRRVGVIVSSSTRESQHLAVVEGAASGAVPVVRDWPYFAGGAHGARTFYPEEWVAAEVEAALERVLAVTADEATWLAASRAAAEAASAWDAATVGPVFESALLGRSPEQ